MKKKVKIGIFLSIILIILIYTWGDRFRSEDLSGFDKKMYCLESYGNLKEAYINKDYKYEENISSYDLKETAKLLDDYDFYEYIIKKENYDDDLIDYYIDKGDYKKAEKLVTELATTNSIYYNTEENKLNRYKNLVDIYLGKEDSENIVKLYYEMLEDRDNRGSLIIDLMEKDYLSKIINGSRDEEVKKQIVDKATESIVSYEDLKFLLDETGYDSEEMKRGMELAQSLIKNNKTEDSSLEIFLYLYPNFKIEKAIDKRESIIITQLDDKYIVRYLSPKEEIKILDEAIVDLPRFVKFDKNFRAHDFVMTYYDQIIMLGYDDGFMIKEYKDGKIVDTVVKDEIVVEDRLVKAKGLNMEIKVTGSYKKRDIYLDNRLVYEVISFEDKGKLSDLIVNKYRVIKTGKLELVEMKKVL